MTTDTENTDASNLETAATEPPAAPPRDYTRAKLAWQKACERARGFGLNAAALGPLFVNDISAPDEWDRQSQHLQDVWFDIVEAATA